MRKFLLLSLLIGLISLIGLVVFFSSRERLSVVTWLTYTNDEFKLSLTYPDSFIATSLAEDQKNAFFLFRATQKLPDALISLRYEKGLGPIKLTGGTILDALVSGVNRRYPDRFPEFKKTKYEEKIIANEKAAVFEFTYLGVDKITRMKQRLVLIVKDNAAFYLSFQSPESESEKSLPDFNKIESSFSFL